MWRRAQADPDRSVGGQGRVLHRSHRGKLPPEVLAAHAAAVLAKLEDSVYKVREAAVQTLGQLPPAELTKHKAAIQKVEKEDEDEVVRRAAAEALSKLQASE